MSDKKTPEVGDEVMVVATVVGNIDNQGDLRIRFRDGRSNFAGATGCTLVDPDEFNVGDQVTFGMNQHQAVIAETELYRLRHADGKLGHNYWRRDELTKLPPEPSYRVERRDDQVQLLSATMLIDWVPMSDAAGVEAAIISWSKSVGIDAVEARKLAAGPTVIASRRITTPVSIVAVRYINGWCAKINLGGITAASYVAETGVILTEAVGKAHFPTVNGPYLEKPESETKP